MDRRVWVILLCIVLIGAFLRIAGLFDDMWLDEIWSYDLAQQVQKPSDILFAPKLQLDNNHPINTLYLWLVGFQRNWVVYRIPSILCGLAGLVYFPFIAMRFGRGVGTLATLLFALSHPLTFFCSEARGYAMLILFSLFAFDMAERYLRRSSWPTAVAFWVGCTLALLSHLTFVFLYGGFLAWTGWHLFKHHKLREVIRLHLVPTLFTAWLYTGFGRHIVIGGGPPVPRLEAFATAAASLIGIRGPYAIELLVTIALAIGCIWTLIALARRGNDLWALLLFGIFIAPTAVFIRQAIVLPQPQPIQPRYFLVLLPFLILGVSFLIVPALKHPLGKAIGGSILAIFLAANLWETAQWGRQGRGHYSEGVRYMASQTPGDVIGVMSDHYLRTTTLLEFYASRVLPENRKVQVYDPDHPPAPGTPAPLWWIRSHPSRGAPPGKSYHLDVVNATYVYDRELSYYGLSGYSWYLYRRS